MGNDDALAAVVAEATLALDAANHAFGRFVTNIIRRQSNAVPAEVQSVREAFQDALLCAPDATTIEGARDLLAALRLALARLNGFFAAPPAGYELAEAMAAPPALEEAIALLSAVLA